MYLLCVVRLVSLYWLCLCLLCLVRVYCRCLILVVCDCCPMLAVVHLIVCALIVFIYGVQWECVLSDVVFLCLMVCFLSRRAILVRALSGCLP